MDKGHLSTAEVAKLLGVSRIAVFKKIKSGDIKARRVGRNFVIGKKSIPMLLGKVVVEAQKKEIEKAVEKTIKEYGQTLRLLGQE